MPNINTRQTTEFESAFRLSPFLRWITLFSAVVEVKTELAEFMTVVIRQ